MSKCPYCDYETPEPNDGDAHVRGWQEVAHMQVEHGDVIRERLAKSGLFDSSVRFEPIENKPNVAYRCSCKKLVEVPDIQMHIRTHMNDPDWDGVLTLEREGS